MKNFLFLVGLALLIQGCGTFQVYRNKAPHNYYYSIFNSKAMKKDLFYREDPDHKETSHHFLWGAVGHHKVYMSKACGRKKLHGMFTHTSFLNGLGTAVTLGLWVPKTVEVWCD